MGLSGYTMFGLGAVFLIGGFAVMGMQNRHIAAVTRETRRRQIAISAILEADADRQAIRALLKNLEAEEKLMGGRKDWEVSVFLFARTRKSFFKSCKKKRWESHHSIPDTCRSRG
jgi:hypothetical protein